jgi:hypothetical protein
MEYIFEQEIYTNHMGVRSSRSGGRDLQKAKKLVKQGLATLELLKRQGGYYGQYSFSDIFTYKVVAVPGAFAN